MKKFIAIIIPFLMAITLVACSGNNSNPPSENITPGSTASASTDDNPAEPSNTSVDVPTDTQPTDEQSAETEKKVLVAYFSATGTTKRIAEYAADSMGADLYEIVPAQPYTDADLNYNTDCRANREMNDPNARPEISGGVESMADYDVVFIGYPIWWGEAPRIVSTFVESYDFSGKTVITFSTSGGSGHNDGSIKALASGADWITGARMRSSASQSDIADWISGLGLDITLK